jgi:SAM-dependent methyltransferase
MLERVGLVWEVERVDWESGALAVRGWMIASSDDDFALTWNGRAFDSICFDARPDVEASHPVLAAEPGVRVRGFAAHTTCPASSFPDGWVKVEWRRRGEAVGPASWSCLAEYGHDWPERERRDATHAQPDLSHFRVAGATAFAQLRAGLKSTTGLDYTDLPSILDWGCGCGRTTRYFASLPVRVTGADVEPDNVAWCERYLPFARFQTIPQHPPTALATASFDLAIGVSTFTYLTEDHQREWLEELRRIVRPGGYLLMTVQGEASLVLGRVGLRQYRRFLREGIVDRLEPEADGYLPELGDYRGTFHSAGYIRRVWGVYFKVESILPCRFGLQDLVVLRRN